MDRESIKEAFFQLKTRDDVASILGISERSLRYFLYKIRPENMYHILICLFILNRFIRAVLLAVDAAD